MAHSQNVMGLSPISRFGLGTNLGYPLSRNEGMSGVGIATPGFDHLNLLNPALLGFNRHANLEVDLWYVNRNLNIKGQKSTFAGAGPGQISVGLPVHRKLTTAFGIRRATNREFRYLNYDTIGGDVIRKYSSGGGGTAQAFLSAGYSVSSNFRIGIEAGYLFGSLEDSLRIGLFPINTNYESVNVSIRKISQVVAKPGVFYRIKMPKYDQMFLTLGATADLTQKIHYRKYSTSEISEIGSSKDTVEDGTKGTLNRPTNYSFAVGLYRELEWALSAELDYQNSNGVAFDESSVKPRNALNFRLGGEYSIGTEKSTRYLNIITWRAGISQQTLPFTLNGSLIHDRKATVGVSFPIVRKETKFTRPLINLAIAYGQRGLKNSYLGLERYWQVTLGFTLNDTQWFTRYRVD